ncbi:MAG: OmpA family protein [Alphaproteobacteria bacterium]|nr:OmpA family protein [Alphaproteobacteria bacterium]
MTNNMNRPQDYSKHNITKKLEKSHTIGNSFTDILSVFVMILVVGVISATAYYFVVEKKIFKRGEQQQLEQQVQNSESLLAAVDIELVRLENENQQLKLYNEKVSEENMINEKEFAIYKNIGESYRADLDRTQANLKNTTIEKDRLRGMLNKNMEREKILLKEKNISQIANEENIKQKLQYKKLAVDNNNLKQQLVKEKQMTKLTQEQSSELSRQSREYAKYQSVFFKSISEALIHEDKIRPVGDRFVIPTDVIFKEGEFSIESSARPQLVKIAEIIINMEKTIPDNVKWVVRIDGHSDIVPVMTNQVYKDNRELSYLRAEAVVRFLEGQGVSPKRVVPTGFGENYPILNTQDREKMRVNRRIEIRLTSPY